MSITSKARRDAKKRRLAKCATRPPPPPRSNPMRNCATRTVSCSAASSAAMANGRSGLDGRIVGGSDSAARVLAMLKRAAQLHERDRRQHPPELLVRR